MKYFIAVMAVTAFLAEQSLAAEWQPMFGTTTADLAAAGWEIQTSSGLSWPDGRQSIVTFWRYKTYLVRCSTAFQADELQTGELCKYSGLGEIPEMYFAPLATDN